MRFSGRKLRKIREARGLQQYELADMCGSFQSSISCYETGIKFPSDGMIIRLAQALEVDPKEFQDR